MYSTALPVRPIELGKHVSQHFGSGAQAAVVKIDTEGAFRLLLFYSILFIASNITRVFMPTSRLLRAGFETRVLESLRPAWHLLGDIVLEIQVFSWASHGVQLEEGLSTLRELIVANGYRVVTLPHTGLGMNRGEAYWKIAPDFVDTCRLPHLDFAVRDPSKANPDWWRGLGNATVMNGQQFESLARKLFRERQFNEFLLTRRHRGHPEVCVDL